MAVKSIGFEGAWMDSTVNRATRRSFQTMILTVIKDARRSGNRRIEAKKETLVSHEDHLQGLKDAGKKKKTTQQQRSVAGYSDWY